MKKFVAEASELISFRDAVKKLNISEDELKRRIASEVLPVFVYSAIRGAFVMAVHDSLEKQIFSNSDSMKLSLLDPLSDGKQLFQEGGKSYSLTDLHFLSSSFGNRRLLAVTRRSDSEYEILCRIDGKDQKYVVSPDAGRVLEFILKESIAGREKFSTRDLLRSVYKDPDNDKISDVFKAGSSKEVFDLVIQKIEKGKYSLRA